MQHTLKKTCLYNWKRIAYWEKKVTMRVLPLEPNKGRWFIRIDLQGDPAIRVSIETE